MLDAVIVSACRTPIGTAREGSLVEATGFADEILGESHAGGGGTP